MSSSEIKVNLVIRFDYESLDDEQRLIIQQRTGEIRERLRRSAQDIWEIGQMLADVRSRLRHGEFDTWLKAEFGWSRRTAYNFISVYETFDERANLAQVDIATSALYLLAAPSTPQTIREKFLQQAKEGKTITHRELREIIQEKKLQSSETIEKTEPSKPLALKPEIVTLLPKVRVEDEKSAIEVTDSNLFLASPTQVNNEIQPGWYLLDKQHLLFCGDTASARFIERVPFASLAIAITADDWDHDWLVERAKTVIIFPESDLKERQIEQLLNLFSFPNEAVLFPWLPDSEMIAIAHKLGRKVYAGDFNPQRCHQAIIQSRLTVERLSL
jgi:hypothetical protein